MAVSDWSTTAGSNTTVGGVSIAEGMSPADVNNAIRAVMADVKAALSGADGEIITGTAGTDGNLVQWNADGDAVDGPDVLDEDDMASDSASAVPTQQSVKAYVDGLGDAIPIDITSSTAAAAYDIPAAWKGFRIRISRFDPVTDDAYLIMRMGVNGSGGAFVTGSNYAIQTINAASPSTLTSSFADETGFILTASTRISSTDETTGGVEIYGTNEAGRKPKGKGWSFAIGSDGTQRGTERRLRLSTTGDYDAIQLFCSSGNISNLQARIERAF